nr:unnamed protein product [Callosobruchus chinensis]
MFTFKISKQLISSIVPEVCTALVEALSDCSDILFQASIFAILFLSLSFVSLGFQRHSCSL